MSTMVRRVCNNCGVECWHNPCANPDRAQGRCTYCGHPPGSNGGSSKREYAELVRARQVNRARLLGVTRA